MLKCKVVKNFVVVVAFTIVLVGCGSADPVLYNGLSTSSYMKPSDDNESGRVPYSYSSKTEWILYKNAIIDQVTIYNGPDSQFGDMSEGDKSELSAYMYKQFSQKLSERFAIGENKGVKTLRIHLTLTGAAKNSTFLAPLSRFDMGGGIYNGIQSMRGGEGAFSGSVIYAVEIYDAATSRLLSSYIEKQYPNAYNIGAAFGSLSAAKKGIEKGAEGMIVRLSASSKG